MLSKWLPWDFIRNHPQTVLNQKGLYTLYSYDSFMERILLNRLYSRNWNDELKVVTGNEITVEWIEENLKTLSLFGGMSSYLILQAEGLPTATKNYLLEEKLELDCYLILSFSTNNALFEQMSKQVEGTFLKVEEPRFWEGAKLLNFLSEETSIRLPYDVQNYILGSLPNTTMDLMTALTMINLHFPGGENASLAQIKELISPVKLDQFALASLFSEKKRTHFFKKLVERDIGFDSLRTIFAFMQGHLFRLADPSYIEKKARPSKYDKEILAYTKLWKKGELEKEMRIFGELEIEAKRKSANLKDQLRVEYLSQY
jgi:DNA polymerase III delta subunit